MATIEAHTVVLLALLCGAAVADLRGRRIPNLMVAAGLAAGVGLAFASGGAIGAWFALKGAAAGFAMLLPFYLLRAFGAGDVKLMAAVGSFVGAWGIVVVTLLAILAAGLFALVASVATGRFNEMLSNIKAMVFAFASSDIRAATSLGRTTVYRVPFAIPALAGTIAWTTVFQQG